MSRADSNQFSVVSFQFQLRDKVRLKETPRATASFSMVGGGAWTFLLITEN